MEFVTTITVFHHIPKKESSKERIPIYILKIYMGKFININTKIPPLPRRLRPGFYGLTVIFYDTPKRNTQIPEQRSWVADTE